MCSRIFRSRSRVVLHDALREMVGDACIETVVDAA